MLCNISISTVNNNLSTFYKTNYNVNLFYPFIDRLMLFDTGTDFLHDEFSIILTKEDLDSINTEDIKNEDKNFINELKKLFGNCDYVEIDGRFRRFIKVGELNWKHWML